MAELQADTSRRYVSPVHGKADRMATIGSPHGDRAAARYRKQRQDPSRHPPKSDILFMDEPAPGLDQLAVSPGRAVVIVFGAADCVLPPIAGARLVRCSDAALAWRYAMTTSTGRIGPGYAVVDAALRLRYLTHDFAPGERCERIQILVNALDGSR